MSGEPRDIPLPVTFVRSMTTPSGVRIHDWRSRTSGRIFEVPEVHVFAASEHLNEGDVGFLRFSAGHLYVVQSELDPVPTIPTRSRPDTVSTAGPSARAGRRRSATTQVRASARGSAHWLSRARRRVARVRLPRLSSRQWFLSMLGVLILVIALRLLVD